MIFLQRGISNRQIRLTNTHNWIAESYVSINLPPSHGIIKELIPKHCEYNAIAVPLYWIGDDFIIVSDAEGRNIHKPIVKGMKAIRTNI